MSQPVTLATPDQWPSGFVYVEDFLSTEEQEKVIKIVDDNGFDQHVHRRQQFFGPKYYHTPQSYRADLQPVDSSLPTEVLGKDDVAITNNQSTQDNNNNNNNNDNNPESTAQSLPLLDTIPDNEIDATNGKNTIGAQNLRHSLGQFEWLIEKLINEGLFERADVRDPFVEYINVDNKIKRIERNYLDKDTSPLFELEVAKLKEMEEKIKIGQEDGDNTMVPEWGPKNTPYPDQILVNEYRVTQNIGQHFDDQLCFGPLIVGVSCGDDCTLILSRPQCIGKADQHVRQIYQEQQKQLHDKETKSDTKDQVVDIEDLDKEFYECHKNDFYTQDGTVLSYPISLRDFTQPSWREGLGHPLLTQYCRCTRDRFLEEHHPYGKILTNVKRQQEFNLLSQYPHVGPKNALDIYGSASFYSEAVNDEVLTARDEMKKSSGCCGKKCHDDNKSCDGNGSCHHNNHTQNIQNTQNKPEHSVASFSSHPSRKQLPSLDMIKKTLEFAQERYDKHVLKKDLSKRSTQSTSLSITPIDTPTSTGSETKAQTTQEEESINNTKELQPSTQQQQQQQRAKTDSNETIQPPSAAACLVDFDSLPSYLQDIIAMIFCQRGDNVTSFDPTQEAKENVTKENNNDSNKIDRNPFTTSPLSPSQTINHITSEDELERFLFNYDYDALLEEYYSIKGDQRNNNDNNNNEKGEKSENAIETTPSLSTSSIKQQVLKLLTPNLVDINTCTNCDDTLYIPVKKGSVYVLAGAARYQYRHAIKKLSKTQQKGNNDYRRISLTVRSLLPGRRQVAKDSSMDHDLSQYNYANQQQQ